MRQSPIIQTRINRNAAVKYILGGEKQKSIMNEIKSLAFQVDEILSNYIFIHDDILKFSIRKLIPIPGIFKRIDYGSHKDMLATLQNELAKIKNRISVISASSNLTQSESIFIEALDNYVIAIVDTISRLRLISEGLYRKSEGTHDYSINQYNPDMKSYNESVEHYMSLGNQLNSLLSGIQ